MGNEEHSLLLKLNQQRQMPCHMARIWDQAQLVATKNKT